MARGKQERKGRGTRGFRKKKFLAVPLPESVFPVEIDSQQSKEPLELRRNLEKQLDAVKNQLAKVTSEYESFRLRMLDERKKTVLYACEAMVFDLLPIVDDFERAISHMDSLSSSNEVFEGIRMIHRRLVKVLEQRGVVRFESVGERFDPYFHEAVQVRDTGSEGAGMVLEELLPGYLFHGRLLRAAKVVVSSNVSANTLQTPAVMAEAESNQLEEEAIELAGLSSAAEKGAAGTSPSGASKSRDLNTPAIGDLDAKAVGELSVDSEPATGTTQAGQSDEEEEIPVELEFEAPIEEESERKVRDESAQVEKASVNRPDSDKWQFEPASLDDEELGEELTRPETEGLDEH